MAYGTVKVDNITFTNGGIDQTVTVSGIVQSISGNITATGTIQAATIIGTSTVSGATVTGDSGQYGNLNSISGVFTTQLSGATITGDIGQYATLTGVSGVFTTQVSGATITGEVVKITSITGVSGVFTTQLSGETVTGTTARFISGVFDTITAANQSFTDATISGNLFVLGSGYFTSGINVSGTISGETVTGNTGLFTDVTGSTLHITTPSGGTPAIVCSGVVSGDANGFIIQGPLVILP